MSGSLDLTNLFIGPDDSWDLADHSVLNARHTFQIQDTNSSQNIKAELEEVWASGRSYGNFTLVENTGGLHEFIPDPEKSHFVPEKDLVKLASDISVRARKCLMKGIAPAVVIAYVQKLVPQNPEYRQYFSKLASDLREAMGLIGTVYIDPSLFPSCPEGVKFMASSKVNPAFVMKLTACEGCVYHKKADVSEHCILFDKRIEARIPWQNGTVMKDIVRKAMEETGASSDVVLRMRKAGDRKSVV